MKQKHFSFHEEHHPSFEIGQRVFVVLGPDKYISTSVRSMNCILGPSVDGNCVLYSPKYEFSNFLFPNEYFDEQEEMAGVGEYRIFDKESEAKKMALFVKVDMSSKEWDEAVGDRENEETIEECELLPCCSQISEIRDILLKCKKYGGLTKLEIDNITWIEGVLTEHNKDKENSPLLYRILEQLGVIK